jgi:predicted Zn-dependent protease with MMP-like domain
MVDIAQLVERWLVEPDVAGSSPVIHPRRKARVARDPGLVRSGPDAFRKEALRVHNIAAEQFEALVVAELDLLPDDMIDGLENVVFVVEDRPEDGSLDLLGLYDGVALTERSQYGFGEMPDRIVLYREPLLELVDDLDELKDQIHITLVHEIAHFYGIDDARLHELGWD